MPESTNIKKKHIPVRMCASCRSRKNKKELLRIVKVQSEDGTAINLDENQKIMGRGMYLCYNLKCFEKLKKIKSKHKSFFGKLDDSVYKKIEEIIKSKEKVKF